jgi:hypothetical protein
MEAIWDCIPGHHFTTKARPSPRLLMNTGAQVCRSLVGESSAMTPADLTTYQTTQVFSLDEEIAV